MTRLTLLVVLSVHRVGIAFGVKYIFSMITSPDIAGCPTTSYVVVNVLFVPLVSYIIYGLVGSSTRLGFIHNCCCCDTISHIIDFVPNDPKNHIDGRPIVSSVVVRDSLGKSVFCDNTGLNTIPSHPG